jgi:putative ABC transport system permease protein
MQLGFYSSLLLSATALYRASDADIFLISPQYVFFGRTGTLPRQRLYQSLEASGVHDVAPLYAGTQMWRNPLTRLRHPMLVIGVDPKLPPTPFTLDAPLFLKNGQVLLDSLTRPYLGPQDIGLTTEIGNYPVQIAGHYRLGPGFVADGAAVMSDETFVRLFANRSIEAISIGLIHVEHNRDASQVAAAVRRVLPRDTRVLTRTEMIQYEQAYWAEETSLGPVFGSGVILGLVIGMIVLYQVMSTDISNHLPEFATLRALGYRSRQLMFIVLEEVSAFAVAGFLAGWLLSIGLYRIVRAQTGVAMMMDAVTFVEVFLLTITMCWSAGWLAARKIRRADPAELW